MNNQYLQYLNSLNKKELVYIIEDLNQLNQELNNKSKENTEVNNKTISDSEYAVIEALKVMIHESVKSTNLKK